jgi:hypothetical protein
MFRARSLAIAAITLTACANIAGAQDFSRWVDVQAFTIGARYRVVEDSRDVRTSNSLQENNAFKARVKADSKGRVSVNVGAFTGSSLTSSWNNTGVGMGDGTAQFHVKQLYVSAAPVKGVEAQVGSLYFVRGENTEITSYDNDAYLAGERVTVKKAKELFFDEISITHGYLGDLNSPSVFDRSDRLSDSNYRQVLVGKKVGKSVAVSADWTDTVNGTTWRGAANVKVPAVVNAVRVEYYGRPESDVWGGSIAAERKLFRGIVASLGYADIDQNYGGLNSDRFNRGARVFTSANIPVVGPLSASVFYTHGVDNNFAVPVNQRFDVVVTYNVLSTLQSIGRR